MKFITGSFLAISMLVGGINVSFAEDINNVEITSISETKIDVGNRRQIEEGGGAIAGAAITWLATKYLTESSTTTQVLASGAGAVAGTYVASKFGTEQEIQGARITYKTGDGKTQTIDVVGNPCSFHEGDAFVITDDKGNKKIHQNVSKNSSCDKKIS